MTTRRRSRAVGAGLRPAPTEARHRARARPRPRGQGRILSRGQFIGLQLSFELTFPLANCFWWVGGGLRPPPTHQKLFSGTGRERRHPAEVRTRPPPMGIFSRQPGIEGPSRPTPLNRQSLLVTLQTRPYQSVCIRVHPCPILRPCPHNALAPLLPGIPPLIVNRYSLLVQRA